GQARAVGRAQDDAREMLGDRTADVAIGAEDLGGGGVGTLDHAVEADEDHRVHESVEDGPEDTPGIERPAGIGTHVVFLSPEDGRSEDSTRPAAGAVATRARSTARSPSAASRIETPARNTARPMGAAWLRSDSSERIQFQSCVSPSARSGSFMSRPSAT